VWGKNLAGAETAELREEVLRLHAEGGHTQKDIARTVGANYGTVSTIRKAAREAGLL
jgi:hypothetical protein